MLDWRFLTDVPPLPSEEFSIYLNYVRKLGFEETPDYDFLRELFAKVMKNNGDIDDQVYDWNLLGGMPCYVHHLAACSIAGSQEEKAGSPPWARTIRPCNRHRTPTRREDPTLPYNLPPSPRLPLWSATDPRRVNPQVPRSCKTTLRPVPGSSPLSPVSLKSTFQLHQTGHRVNRIATISGMNHTLATKRMTGRRRWSRPSKTHPHHLLPIVRVVCKTGGFRNRMRMDRQSLVFGGFLLASVHDGPAVLPSTPLSPPDSLLFSYHTNIVHDLSPLHLLLPFALAFDFSWSSVSHDSSLI